MKRAFFIKIISIFLALITALFAVSACSAVEPTKDKLTVTATIVPLAGFVKKVCGDKADVITMIPSGYSPETYEPTPKQKVTFASADICFAIGVQAENTMLANSQVKVIRLQDAVAAKYDDLTFAENSRDPHIWLSVKRVKVMVDEIAVKMSALDSENAAYYAQNAAAFIDELTALDSELTAAVSGMAYKKIIVFHPAFGYLCDEYGITMYALEEEGKEATVGHLQEMIDLAKAENIKAIFYQEEIDSKQAKAFAEEIGGKTVMLSPLAEDFIANLRKMVNTIIEVNKSNG